MSENSEKIENPLEIPEAAAPPLESLVEEEGAPGNPETREKIQIPDEKSPEPPVRRPRGRPRKKVADEKKWVEIAQGKRAAKSPPLTPEEQATAETARAEKARIAVEQKIRTNKASGLVTVAELGFLFLARRFGVPEDEIKFRPDEKRALQEAIEPLVSVEAEDPWGNLMMVAMAVGGPRVVTIAAARDKQLAASEVREEDSCTPEAA